MKFLLSAKLCLIIIIVGSIGSQARKTGWEQVDVIQVTELPSSTEDTMEAKMWFGFWKKDLESNKEDKPGYFWSENLLRKRRAGKKNKNDAAVAEETTTAASVTPLTVATNFFNYFYKRDVRRAKLDNIVRKDEGRK